MQKHITASLTLLASMLMMIACQENGNVNQHGDITISGRINTDSPLFFLLEELTPSEIIPLDTVSTDKEGNFSYSVFAEHAGFYRIRLLNGQFITLAAEPNENILITADAGNFSKSYEVNGSHGSYLLWKINRSITKASEKADSIREIYREMRGNPGFKQIREQLKNDYELIIEEQTAFLADQIEENPNSLASILALYQFFEERRLIDEERHFHHFEKLSKTLCSQYPSNKHVINLKKWVSDKKRENHLRHQNETTLSPGNIAPEISLPDPQGNHITLSSLRGNLVLIDFWAAWCPPCREANHTLTGLYRQYNHRGFDILGISLDRSKQQWLNAIEKDSIIWHQVSDLRFMNSPVVSLYNVTEVPHYILLDRDGKIIARNFRIHELENLIKEHI